MLSCPIRKGNFLLGSSIFALINQVHIRLSGAILRPELVPVEEEILVSTLVMLLLIIFVVFRLTGNVIDHKVKHEIVLFSQAFDIFPISKGWIYLIIVHRRKATVSCRGEKWQEVNTTYCISKIFLQIFIEILQVISQAVRVSN